jgi:heterodisulfide reductase subunit D
MKVAFACPLCGACGAMCSPHTYFGSTVKDHTILFEDLREALASAGYIPEKHAKFGECIEENHNPYYEPHEARFDWLEEGLAKDEGAVYFAGCTSSYREQQIAKATAKSLDAAGIPFRVLGEDEWCCGSPLLRTGQKKKAKETARHNVEAIRKTGAKTVITSCAGCYRTIVVDWPKILGLRSLGFNVVHSSEFFASLIDEGKVKFDNKIDMTATYHDPCHIGRHIGVYGGVRDASGDIIPSSIRRLKGDVSTAKWRWGVLPSLREDGIYDEPRKVLKEIGVKIVEMPRNRENAWCCGSGGGVKSAFPEFALWAAGERVKEAESVGVDTITTSCPFCVRNLSDGAKELNKPFKVYDVMELVSEALK